MKVIHHFAGLVIMGVAAVLICDGIVEGCIVMIMYLQIVNYLAKL